MEIWIPFIGPVPVDPTGNPAGGGGIGWSVPIELYEFFAAFFPWFV